MNAHANLLHGLRKYWDNHRYARLAQQGSHATSCFRAAASKPIRKAITIAPFTGTYRHAFEETVMHHAIRYRPPLARRALIAVAVDLALALAAQSAWADCFDDAGAYQRVNPMVLRAIAWQESHNRPNATHLNANGSLDYGVMQINSIHLRELSRYHIDRDALMQPCKNVYIAAWHLRGKMDKYGNTWAAIGAYHSETPAERDVYARHIAAILGGWHQLRQPEHAAQK
jgi:soluble lytic murein transglycosylase-like protein